MPSISKSARRLLVLTYRFPPQGRVGAHRTTKFVRYMSRYGWQPVVHTVRNPYCTHWDHTLSRQIPDDVEVFRTPTFEVEALEDRLRALRDWVRPRRSVPSNHAASVSAPSARAYGSGVRDYVWRYWLSPDPQILWIPGALLRSQWIARRRAVSAMYSSSPPQSVQILALKLHRRLGIPWIADMRDPWTEGLHRRYWYSRNEPRQRREERWERAVCREADRVVVATPGTQRMLQEKYPETAHKVTCITNGFDPEDFSVIVPGRRTLESDHLHVTLTGNVESAFDLLPLLRAVAALVARRPEARHALRINFVGTRKRTEWGAFLGGHGLDDVVRFHPMVPHPEALQILAESDVALIAAAERQEASGVKISAKLFEYLFLRKPVLALIREGVTTDILDRAGLGFLASPDDAGQIETCLERLLDQHQGAGIEITPDEAYISTFDRRRQAAQLASLLDDVSSGR